MTRREFGRILQHLGHVYPRVEMTQERATAFFGYVKHIEFESLAKAVRQHVRTREWFPSVAELLALVPAKPGPRPLQLTDGERIGPAEAGEAVRQLLERLGYGKKP